MPPIAALEMFADNAPLCRWIRMASNACGLSGPAGSHFLAQYGERARFGLKINAMVRSGVVKAPIVMAAIIWIVDRWHRPIARRRACWTAAMRLPTGRC